MDKRRMKGHSGCDFSLVKVDYVSKLLGCVYMNY